MLREEISALQVFVLLFLLMALAIFALQGIASGASLPAPGSLPEIKGKIPPLPPLPDLRAEPQYRSHAVERHGADAIAARLVPLIPLNPCRFYVCNGPPNNILRLCWDQSLLMYAVQFLFYDSDAGGWVEGSSWLMRENNIARWLERRGCVSVR